MDKNTKLAFFLIALIIILYPYFLPKQEKDAANDITEEKVYNETDENNVSEEVSDTLDNTTADPSSPAIVTGEDMIINEPVYISPSEKDIKIQTELYSAVISSAGGVINSWKIKKYKSRQDTSKIVELIKEGTSNLGTEIALSDGKAYSDVIYEASTYNIDLSSGKDSDELILEYKDVNGVLKFSKKYIFYSDRYSFDLEINTEPVFEKLSDEYPVSVKWTEGIKFTEVSDKGKNLNREDYYRETYVKKGDELFEYDDNDDPEKVTGNIDWAATRSKYFEVFFLSGEDSPSAFINSPASAPKEEFYTSMGFIVFFDKDNDPVKNLEIYFGPMDKQVFNSYDREMERTMNWGWDIIKPFSLGIYWALKFLHRFIDNYGLVIILLSLIVNTLVLPFTLKSYKSQAEMKKIQPEMKLIKEKYKADMQKQQAATMELYKKHGVNPFGTCLPTLIPMPVLYGMFIVFGATIEFRGADFMLWINDLSMPEVMFTLPFSIPLYGANVGLMPILMGATMFIQMKDSVSDPNQKMMVYFMPVFLTVLFNNLSSGLILYYTVGNFYRIIQQKIAGVNKK